jgi:hypothetical protein
VFVTGGDALEIITPAIEERLRDMRAHETLSRGVEGLFRSASLRAASGPNVRGESTKISPTNSY